MTTEDAATVVAVRRSVGERLLRLLATALAVASCIPMLAMLPAGLVTVMAWLGVKSSSDPVASVSGVLAPVARPMLVIATLSLVVAALRCGRGPVALAAVAGTLLYVSMYVLPSGSDASMAGMAVHTPSQRDRRRPTPAPAGRRTAPRSMRVPSPLPARLAGRA